LVLAAYRLWWHPAAGHLFAGRTILASAAIDDWLNTIHPLARKQLHARTMAFVA